jgi:U32 family peptidase
MSNQGNIPELLSPARDREAFLAAVAAGSDAIYCGVTGGLNARRKAAGISPGELPALCGLAHAHGVRVYVAMNIAVGQAELAGAVEAARSVLAAGADALIIQDLGFMAEVRREIPEAEIHVSTQANVHDARGVLLCERLGANRVTLSRELPLSEIASIAAETSAELEVFSHGAICPSYSGVCMLSSFLREGRSPNRGLCAQPCRLPFDLVGEEGMRLQPRERERALCTHDNCVAEHVAELAEAGVASLKLEGRMKPAAYVWAVTSAYRTALDELAGVHGAAEGLPFEPARMLKRTFNRGLTSAYLAGTSGNELMSYERSGNRGELVGVVSGFEPEPGFVPRDGQQLRGTVFVRLDEPVGEGDSIELRPLDNPGRFLVVRAPRTAVAGETLACACPRPMAAGCEARLTKSVELENAAARAVMALEQEL